MGFVPGRCALALAGLLALSAALAEEPRKEEPKAPDAAGLVARSLDALRARQGFHVRFDGVADLGQEKMEPYVIGIDGWVRNPDIAFGRATMNWVKNKPKEWYRKGRRVLLRNVLEKWVPPRPDPGGPVDPGLVSPWEYLQEFQKAATGHVFLADEKLGDADCRVVQAKVPSETVFRFIGVLGIDPEAFQKETAVLTLKLWIQAGDALLRQATAELELDMLDTSGKNLPPKRVEPHAKFEVFDYDKDVGLEQVPEEVRKMWAEEEEEPEEEKANQNR